MVRSRTRTMALVAGLVGLSGCDPRVDYTEVPVGLAVSSTNVTPIGILAGPAVASQVVVLAATPGSVDNLTMSVVFRTGGTGWLTAQLDRTSVSPDQPATLSITSTPGARPLGIYTASIVLSGNNLAVPISISVRFTIDPRPPARIGLVTQPGGPVANGSQLPQQPVVQLLDDQNQPTAVANVVVSAGLASGVGQLTGGITATTNSSGRATFATVGVLGTAGPKTLTFTAPNLTPVTSAPLTVLPGGAAQIVAVSALSQTANAGTAVAVPPRVRVVDQSGNGVAGFTVGFAASAGSVIAPATSAVSAADGIAQLTSWTLNPAAGANSVTATANGLAGSPIAFTATGLVGPATIFAKQSGDNLIGLIGNPLGTPHVVKVTDAFGNGVGGVSVTWGVTGGGSVAPGASVTGSNGSTQAIRTLGPTPGPVTTTATATIGGTPVTLTFTITAALAGPSQIVKVAGDAQTQPVATTLPVPIQVQVLDALNAPQPNVQVTFTTSAPGGSFPGGVTIATDANGMAGTTWKLGTVAGVQTAQAAVGGPAPALFTATATPGAVSTTISTVAASPNTITAGGGGSTITVTARDVHGNPIAGETVNLGLAGTASLSTNTGTTNAAGQVTSVLTGTAAGAKVVSATIGGAAINQSATVTITAGLPATMTAFSPTAFAVRFGQAVSNRPQVLVTDQFSNPVGGVTVTFGVTSGQSTLASAVTATGSNGVASVSSWVIASIFAGPGESDVYNRVVAASGVLPSITFTGTATVSHSADLMQMYSSCAGCHDAFEAPDVSGNTASAYASLVTNAGTRYVIPGDSTSFSANSNLLWYWPRPGGSHFGGDYTVKLMTIVKAWIRQGAPNN